MAISDQEQKGINVPMHKRLAAGEKLDGTSLKGKDTSKPAGGLSGVIAKKQK
jgi:hypothetical protein